MWFCLTAEEFLQDRRTTAVPARANNRLFSEQLQERPTMSSKSRVSRRKFIGGMVAFGGASAAQQPTGGIRGFDHVALPMQNTDAMLAFYRSQHEGHSWLAALSVVLDTCSLIISNARDGGPPQAAATFSAAQRVLNVVMGSLEVKRLDGADQPVTVSASSSTACALEALMPGSTRDSEATACLVRLQGAYRPSVLALSDYLLIPLPVQFAATPGVRTLESRSQVVNRLTEPGLYED